MQIQDDFSELHLFFSQPINFTLLDEENNKTISFSMHLPTFQQLQFDMKFRLFITFLNTDLAVLQKNFSIFPNLGSHFALLRRMLAWKSLFHEYIELFTYTCDMLKIPIEVGEFEYTIQGISFTHNLFQLIVKYIMLACGLQNNQSDNAQLNKYNEKIARIKAQNQQNLDNTLDAFLDIIVGLMYEFKISKEELLNSTMFFIQTMGTYYSYIIQHQVSLIGAGNGLSKKIYNISRRKQQ